MNDDERKRKPHVPLDYQAPVKKPADFNAQIPKSVFWTLLLAGVLAVAWILTRPPPRLYDENGERCLGNLHQIALAILLYQQDYGGVNPDSLDQLVYEHLTPGVFVCPASKQTIANVSDGAATQEIARAILAGGHITYIYLGKGLTDKTTPANAVIAYEPLGNHDDGMHVLCGDGRAILVNVPRGRAIIAATAATTRPVMLPP